MDWHLAERKCGHSSVVNRLRGAIVDLATIGTLERINYVGLSLQPLVL